MSYQPKDYDILTWRKWNGMLNHVAIVLFHEDEPWVYEAFPPRIRRMPYEQHRQKWLFRTSQLSVMRNDTLTLREKAAMRSRLIELLGRRYSWLPNFWMESPWLWHCIEYVCEGLVAAFAPPPIFDVDLSRVGPKRFRVGLEGLEYYKVEQ